MTQKKSGLAAQWTKIICISTIELRRGRKKSFFGKTIGNSFASPLWIGYHQLVIKYEEYTAKRRYPLLEEREKILSRNYSLYRFYREDC